MILRNRKLRLTFDGFMIGQKIPQDLGTVTVTLHSWPPKKELVELVSIMKSVLHTEHSPEIRCDEKDRMRPQYLAVSADPMAAASVTVNQAGQV